MSEEKVYNEGEEGLCENCGKRNGTYCIDPYTHEIGGRIVWLFLCSECYRDSCEDI